MFPEESPEFDGQPEQADPQPAEGSPRPVPFPVVGIGASAGGLEAVSHLLAHLPQDTGMAFVVVQHLDPSHPSKLAELLGKATRLRVVEMAHGTEVEPDRVYVIPPNAALTIARGVLQLEPRSQGRGPHLPIDHFFKSLAEGHRAGAIGVILSGTGSDGTFGVQEIKGAGGFTFAQDEASAKYPGMPQSAARSGCIDLILSPEEIAGELTRIGRHPLLGPVAEARLGPAVGTEALLRKVLDILRTSAGVDFSAYRETTVRRRIMRRIVLRSGEDLARYAEILEHEPDEVQALYHDLLINVTSFFRDPESFEALKQAVFPGILKGRDANSPIRAWVAGCSTGQEAYSLAIALLEFLEDKPTRPPIQIFGTDLSDAVSLMRAREGLYPNSIEAQVSPERLRRHFTKTDDHYRISKAIRDMCVFARHNVAADPPFSHMDLICCRNLLIYLGVSLQRRVIPTLHYALKPAGFLWLGPSETVGTHSDLFSVVDQRHRFFAKKVASGRSYPQFATEAIRGASGARGLPIPASPATDWHREADRVALGEYAPPGLLVTEDLDILQFRGQTGPFLQPSPGEPSFNLLKMAREGLHPEVRKAVEACRQQGAPVHRRGVRVRDEQSVREVDLRVLPVKSAGSGGSCFLVLFEDPASPDGRGSGEATRSSGSVDPGKAPGATDPWKSRFLRRLSASRPARGPASQAPPGGPADEALRRELESMRDYLRSLIQRHDAANEELKSANEEILSSNEELQSTNEELETAKEELQSINEELISVNEQLKQGNRDLARLNDDLTNLLGSAGVPMFVLGVDLCIRRFTPAAAKVLELVAADVGRPIGQVRLAVAMPELEAMVAGVIDTIHPEGREIRGGDGRWYSLRVHPYRTSDNKIDGAVVVLADIHEIKGIEARLRESLDYSLAVVDTVREPLVVLDPAMRVRSANRAFYRAFGTTESDTEGRLLYELVDRRWNIPALRSLLGEILPRRKTIEDFEVVSEPESVGRKVMLLNARRMSGGDDGPELILLAIEDVTERRRAEELLHDSEQRTRLLLENVTDYAIFFTDPSGLIVGWDEGAARVLGYRTEEILGDHLSRFFTPEDVAEGVPEEELATAAREGRATDENDLVRKDGSRFWASGVITALRDGAGGLRGFVKIVRDITEQRRTEVALRESEHRLTIALSAAQMGTWHWDIPANRKSFDENLARLCGIGPGEEIRTLEDSLRTIHPDDRAAVARAYDRSVREGAIFDVEFRVAWPDGNVRWLKDKGDIFHGDDGRPLYMTGACVDITFRKRAEEDLRRARDELELRVRERTVELLAANTSLEEQFAHRRDLLRRLSTAEEDERRRISRELHDEMGQYLTALILELKLLEDAIREDEPARARLERLQQVTGELGKEVHRFAVELRPTSLDDVGLPTTIQNYLDEWSSRTGVRSDFHAAGLESRLPASVETALYRIAQEALTNVAKHAGAGRVSVILESRDGHATLIVEDDGRGFDVEGAMNGPGGVPHLGLLGMRERMTMAGGTLTIESGPGGPTTLFARIPIAEAGERGHDG